MCTITECLGNPHFTQFELPIDDFDSTHGVLVDVIQNADFTSLKQKYDGF